VEGKSAKVTAGWIGILGRRGRRWIGVNGAEGMGEGAGWWMRR
jgi:hypothetical protein